MRMISMDGNEAIARVAIEADSRLFSGYCAIVGRSAQLGSLGNNNCEVCYLVDSCRICGCNY